MSVDNNIINIESRRYIGNKAKLADWIMNIIKENTCDVHSFCDIFAGSGSMTNRALGHFEKLIMNDFLYSNNAIYKGFFGTGEWDTRKLAFIIEEWNNINVKTLKENYFSEMYGNKYYEHSVAKHIGYIRENLERRRSELTEKEYNILLTTIIYNIDRLSNTCGHFDAYIKKDIAYRPLILRPINVQAYKHVEIFREDANELARKIKVDVTYIDPPYNSRQYSRFYHVYETLVKWNKPKLYGVAMKPKEENMSEYCKSKALDAFKDLIANLDTRYIIVSYNNTYKSKSSSSANKIRLEEISEVLEAVGETTIHTHSHNAFNTGKTEFDNHMEYLFVTRVYGK